jgi:ubiquinone/menaquinone biosynthesis C-methylase UbiE
MYWERKINGESQCKMPPKNIIQLLGEYASILDLGCGTGRVLKYIREIGFKGQLYGVDWSRNSLAKAQKTTSDVKLYEGDIRNTPFADNTFDLIILSAVLTCQVTNDDLYQVLKEANRITKNDANLYISDFLLTYNIRNIIRYLKGFIMYKKLGVFWAGHIFIHYRKNKIIKIIKNTGFRIIEFKTFKTKTMNNNLHNGFSVLCQKIIKTHQE